MWVFLNDAFFSIVEPSVDSNGSSEELLVRARFREDLGRVFPNAVVEETEKRDYAFRALIKRTEVADALAAEVSRINYNNFKKSISLREKYRHDAYLGVWVEMYKAQIKREYSGTINWYDWVDDTDDT